MACSAPCVSSFFFFQAEDGIRDDLVTGVQTCALPILALRLASYFGWRYIDSGAMYRAVALCAAERGIPWTDEPALVQLCAPLTFEFPCCGGQAAVHVDGRNVTQAIRSQAVGEGASLVATHPR